MHPAKTAETMLNFGLDFTIEKAPLFTKDTNYAVDGNDGSMVEYEEDVQSKWFATRNSDTKELLGVVTDSYVPVQHEDIIDTLIQVAGENNLEVVHGSAINGGQKGFVQMRINKDNYVGNDTIKNFVVATWGSDGKTGVRIGFSNQVVSCANQFFSMHGKASHRFHHTGDTLEQLRQIPVIMSQQQQDVDEVYETFQKWNDISIYSDRAVMDFKDQIYKELVGIDPTIPIADWTKVDPITGKQKYSQRKINKAFELNKCINLELQAHGENLWGLFNGVTYYTNHKNSVPNRLNGRSESLIFGGGNKMNQEAYAKIEAFAGQLV